MTELTEITGSEQARAAWDRFVLASPYGHLQQTFRWAEIKAAQGWTPRPLSFSTNGEIAGVALAFERRMPLLGTRFIQIPFGPVLDYSDPGLVRQFFKCLKAYAATRRVALIKVHPYVFRSGDGCGCDVPAIFRELRLSEGALSLGFKWTLEVDLNKDEDALWEGVEKRARSAIRRSQKTSLEVRAEKTGEAFDAFIDLYVATYAATAGAPASRTPLDAFRRSLLAEDFTDLIGVWNENRLVAGSVIGKGFCNRASLLWKASTLDPVLRREGINAAAEWAVIQRCHELGLSSYDLGGVTPDAEEGSKPHGIYLFKRSFGGSLRQLIGTFDMVLDPWMAELGEQLSPLYLRGRAHVATLMRSLAGGR